MCWVTSSLIALLKISNKYLLNYECKIINVSVIKHVLNLPKMTMYFLYKEQRFESNQISFILFVYYATDVVI